MNDKIDDGGSVFPCTAEQYHMGLSGMSLRDWFAGMALQGLLACPDPLWNDSDPSKFATVSFRLADAMLEARKK